MGSLGIILTLKDSGTVLISIFLYFWKKFYLILGYSFDDTIVSWILTVLLILFMYTVGIAAVSFPWVLMGKIRDGNKIWTLLTWGHLF